MRRSKKASKLCVTGLCEGNSPHKGPVTRKAFSFDDVIMEIRWKTWGVRTPNSHLFDRLLMLYIIGLPHKSSRCRFWRHFILEFTNKYFYFFWCSQWQKFRPNDAFPFHCFWYFLYVKNVKRHNNNLSMQRLKSPYEIPGLMISICL